MKTLILNLGQLVLNIGVILGFIGAVITALPYFKYGQTMIGIFTVVGISLGVVIASFVLYLLIDIRDKISENNQLLQKKA